MKRAREEDPTKSLITEDQMRETTCVLSFRKTVVALSDRLFLFPAFIANGLRHVRPYWFTCAF